jgi:hypothetical protein
MSQKYPGGIISKTAPVPTGPYENGTAPGIWTLEQQAEFVKQGIWPIAGNVPNYIEDVFQTWLYTGNGSTQTITNGIDLAGKGGLVWTKSRSNATDNVVFDTAMGGSSILITNSTSAKITTSAPPFLTFNSNGFSFNKSAGGINQSPDTYASWTFREQPKFFDVVTWTGDGAATKTINHNLGSEPGCIITKCTSTTNDWWTYHRGASATPLRSYVRLNATDAVATSGSNLWGVTSTTITVPSALTLNDNGATYVAYLFAHNAGGFGLTGTDNVISCGSYTGNGSADGPTINLGYEPQWLMVKCATSDGGADPAQWWIIDNMRGWESSTFGTLNYLAANSSQAELERSRIELTSTGFKLRAQFVPWNGNGQTYIYIAIRRGPMKVPTTGTSVFDAGTRSGSGSVAKTNSNVLTDLAVIKRFTSASEYWAWTPRLGGSSTLQSNSTDAEIGGAMATNPWDTMTGAFVAASNGATNTSTLVDYSFRRAPGFFDVVCYTGTGSVQNASHNLAVVPELMIVKSRSAPADWPVYAGPLGATKALNLNLTFGEDVFSGWWNNTSPTSTQFTVGVNSSSTGVTYVSYLFASCPGVSKVGSFTGTGATQVINCGFTGGARFVLIKSTSTTGNWMVWDSARGIVSGNDPYLALNSTAAEVTNTDWVDTAASGFELSNAGGNLANSSGVSYIFLAIA